MTQFEPGSGLGFQLGRLGLRLMLSQGEAVLRLRCSG